MKFDARTRKGKKKAKPTQKKQLTSRFLAQAIAQIAGKKQATDIEMIDVRKNSSICNYFVICSASSRPQLRAIADAIDEVMTKMKIKVPAWQGNIDSNWIVMDFINVVVHIFGKEERAKYKLEELWGKGGIIYHT